VYQGNDRFRRITMLNGRLQHVLRFDALAHVIGVFMVGVSMEQRALKGRGAFKDCIPSLLRLPPPASSPLRSTSVYKIEMVCVLITIGESLLKLVEYSLEREKRMQPQT
jgi:hypothetical protein